MFAFPRTNPALDDEYNDMDQSATVPLWLIYSALVAKQPAPSAKGHCWSYAQLRPSLLRAGESISAEEAERRVLILCNPGLDRPTITHTLVAGLQLVMPGESAPCHQHTHTALRFVLEGTDEYTSVEGECCTM